MELKGKGFTLRGWKTTDAEALQKRADNTNISDFLLDRFPSPYTLDDAVNWIALMQNQDPMVNFVIAADDSLIGVIGLEFREDVYRKTALLGSWISEEYWGRGIMPQAIKLFTAYAFANLDVLRIQAGVLSSNPKSLRVLEKAGYVKEGVMKNAIIKNGVILNEHIYAMCPPTS